MPLDPNIYSQLQPNVAMGLGDVVNRYVDQTQADAEKKNRLAQMAQAGELQGLQLQQAKQAAADEAAYRGALQEAGGDVTGLVKKLRAQGVHGLADQLEKQQIEQQKSGLEFGIKRHEAMTNVFGDIAQNPDQYQTIIDASVKSGALHPEDAVGMKSRLATLPPEKIAEAANRGSILAKDWSARQSALLNPAPQMHIIETEGGQQVVDLTNPNTPKQFGPKPKQDNTLVAVVGPDGVTPILVNRTQAAGMTPFSKGAASPNQHIADARESNALLDQVEKIGPLATGSGAGKLRDIAAGFVGQSTEGANNAAKMKVLGASLTSKVPKMSGPQSDKDVAMYKEAAGNIADASVPWEQKKAAIETIREINNRQLSYGNNISGQPAQAAPTFTKTKSGATTSGW